MKYKLTENTNIVNGVILHQIQALKDFGNVKAGDLGGWIESEENLSQEGNCWVSSNARVFCNAQVYGNARVFCKAQVNGNARVFGNAQVFDNALVFGNAQVCGNALVFGNAQVFDNALVFGNAQVCGNAWVFDNAQVFDNALVSEWVYGNAQVFENARVYGDAKVNEPKQNDFSTLELKVINWAKERRIIPNATPEAQFLKAVSEMGELADALNKKQYAEMQDAVGDVVVCLINLCALQQTSITECLELAWEQIKDRKGTLLPNGCFVKEEAK